MNVNAFLDEIGIASTKRKFFTFSKSKETTHNNWDNVFKPTDFGWRGKPKTADLQHFLEKPFDVLISYYNENSLPLQLVSGLHNANFKVGITGSDQEIHGQSV